MSEHLDPEPEVVPELVALFERQSRIPDELRIKARVQIAGCDGYTNFEIEGTEAEISYLEEIARISTAVSEYSCEPTIEVSRIKDGPVEPTVIKRLSIEDIAASIGFAGRSPEDWKRVDG